MERNDALLDTFQAVEQMLLVLDLSLRDKLRPSLVELFLILGVNRGKSKPMDRDVLPDDLLEVLHPIRQNNLHLPSRRVVFKYLDRSRFPAKACH